MEQLNHNQVAMIQVRSGGTTPPPVRTEWQVNAECIALRDDGRWYRAKIIDIKDNVYVVTRLLSLFVFILEKMDTIS